MLFKKPHNETIEYMNERDPAARQDALDAQAARIHAQTDGECGWVRGSDEYMSLRFDCVAHHAKVKRKSDTGERNNAARLTDEIVLEARRLARNGTPRADIARQFNLASSTVSNIISGRSWSHLPGAMPNSKSKLTPDTVRAIRKAAADGATWASLSRKYNVSVDAIRQAAQRNTWAHIV